MLGLNLPTQLCLEYLPYCEFVPFNALSTVELTQLFGPGTFIVGHMFRTIQQDVIQEALAKVSIILAFAIAFTMPSKQHIAL
jgi:hypothetical protein